MGKEWKNEEIDYLKENIGFYKVTTLAEKMGRSYDSVRVKMSRLGLSNTKNLTGLVTIGELARILKVDRTTVKGWIEGYGLPYIKKTTRKTRSFYFVDPEDFWNWAKANKDKVQFSNIEYQVLPPEPDWVKEERRKEKAERIVKKRAYKVWTTREDKMLIEMRKRHFTYEEIGKRLNRSAISVARRYKRIKE